MLATLLKPPAGEADALLVGYQPPLALLEADGAALVVLDVAGASPEEVVRRAERVVAAQSGRLLLVVVGGGADYKAALSSVGERAQKARLLSTYLVDGAGVVERVVGPRSSVIEKAGTRLLATAPLALGEVAAQIARGQKEREEAVNFAAQLQGRRPWVTMVLVGACVLLHLLDATMLGTAWGSNSRQAFREGQVWRLLTAAFLHADAIHLLMNMMGLWAFGGFLEPVLGWRRYLVLYGASALAGSLASALFGDPVRPSVGASGALWGLMLGGFALMRAGKTIFPARIARQLRQRLVGIVGINVVISFVPHIDKFAHFGGGIAGFLLVWSGLLAPRSVGAVGDESFPVRLLAPLTAVLMAGSLVVALLMART